MIRETKYRYRSRPLVKRLAEATYGLWETTARSVLLRSAGRSRSDQNAYAGLFVCHGTSEYPTSLKSMRKLWAPFYKRGFPLFIVNNMPDDPVTPRPGEHYLEGTNTEWEFSAWQQAHLQYIAKFKRPPAWYICVTSAFVRHDTVRHYARYINPATLRHLPPGIIGPACVHWTGDYRCAGYHTSRFIRTDAFAVSGHLIEEVGFLGVSNAALENISPARPNGDSLFHNNDNTSPDFRDHLNKWLSQGWHKSNEISGPMYPFLRKKLQACCNERLLAARIATAGGIMMHGLKPNRLTGLSSVIQI